MKRTLTALILLAVSVGACGPSFQELEPHPEQIQKSVKLGDEVEIMTKDRQRFQFTVEQINETGLGSDMMFIEYRNIADIKRKIAEENKTW